MSRQTIPISTPDVTNVPFKVNIQVADGPTFTTFQATPLYNDIPFLNNIPTLQDILQQYVNHYYTVNNQVIKQITMQTQVLVPLVQALFTSIRQGITHAIASLDLLKTDTNGDPLGNDYLHGFIHNEEQVLSHILPQIEKQTTILANFLNIIHSQHQDELPSGPSHDDTQSSTRPTIYSTNAMIRKNGGINNIINRLIPILKNANSTSDSYDQSRSQLPTPLTSHPHSTNSQNNNTNLHPFLLQPSTPIILSPPQIAQYMNATNYFNAYTYTQSKKYRSQQTQHKNQSSLDDGISTNSPNNNTQITQTTQTVQNSIKSQPLSQNIKASIATIMQRFIATQNQFTLTQPLPEKVELILPDSHNVSQNTLQNNQKNDNSLLPTSFDLMVSMNRLNQLISSSWENPENELFKTDLISSPFTTDGPISQTTTTSRSNSQQNTQSQSNNSFSSRYSTPNTANVPNSSNTSPSGSPNPLHKHSTLVDQSLMIIPDLDQVANPPLPPLPTEFVHHINSLLSTFPNFNDNLNSSSVSTKGRSDKEFSKNEQPEINFPSNFHDKDLTLDQREEILTNWLKSLPLSNNSNSDRDDLKNTTTTSTQNQTNQMVSKVDPNNNPSNPIPLDTFTLHLLFTCHYSISLLRNRINTEPDEIPPYSETILPNSDQNDPNSASPSSSLPSSTPSKSSSSSKSSIPSKSSTPPKSTPPKSTPPKSTPPKSTPPKSTPQPSSLTFPTPNPALLLNQKLLHILEILPAISARILFFITHIHKFSHFLQASHENLVSILSSHFQFIINLIPHLTSQYKYPWRIISPNLPPDIVPQHSSTLPFLTTTRDNTAGPSTSSTIPNPSHTTTTTVSDMVNGGNAQSPTVTSTTTTTTTSTPIISSPTKLPKPNRRNGKNNPNSPHSDHNLNHSPDQPQIDPTTGYPITTQPKPLHPRPYPNYNAINHQYNTNTSPQQLETFLSYTNCITDGTNFRALRSTLEKSFSHQFGYQLTVNPSQRLAALHSHTYSIVSSPNLISKPQLYAGTVGNSLTKPSTRFLKQLHLQTIRSITNILRNTIHDKATQELHDYFIKDAQLGELQPITEAELSKRTLNDFVHPLSHVVTTTSTTVGTGKAKRTIVTVNPPASNDNKNFIGNFSRFQSKSNELSQSTGYFDEFGVLNGAIEGNFDLNFRQLDDMSQLDDIDVTNSNNASTSTSSAKNRSQTTRQNAINSLLPPPPIIIPPRISGRNAVAIDSVPYTPFYPLFPQNSSKLFQKQTIFQPKNTTQLEQLAELIPYQWSHGPNPPSSRGENTAPKESSEQQHTRLNNHQNYDQQRHFKFLLQQQNPHPYTLLNSIYPNPVDSINMPVLLPDNNYYHLPPPFTNFTSQYYPDPNFYPYGTGPDNMNDSHGSFEDYDFVPHISSNPLANITSLLLSYGANASPFQDPSVNTFYPSQFHHQNHLKQQRENGQGVQPTTNPFSILNNPPPNQFFSAYTNTIKSTPLPSSPPPLFSSTLAVNKPITARYQLPPDMLLWDDSPTTLFFDPDGHHLQLSSPHTLSESIYKSQTDPSSITSGSNSVNLGQNTPEFGRLGTNHVNSTQNLLPTPIFTTPFVNNPTNPIPSSGLGHFGSTSTMLHAVSQITGSLTSTMIPTLGSTRPLMLASNIQHPRISNGDPQIPLRAAALAAIQVANAKAQAIAAQNMYNQSQPTDRRDRRNRQKDDKRNGQNGDDGKGNNKNRNDKKASTDHRKGASKLSRNKSNSNPVVIEPPVVAIEPIVEKKNEKTKDDPNFKKVPKNDSIFIPTQNLLDQISPLNTPAFNHPTPRVSMFGLNWVHVGSELLKKRLFLRDPITTLTIPPSPYLADHNLQNDNCTTDGNTNVINNDQAKNDKNIDILAEGDDPLLWINPLHTTTDPITSTKESTMTDEPIETVEIAPVVPILLDQYGQIISQSSQSNNGKNTPTQQQPSSCTDGIIGIDSNMYEYLTGVAYKSIQGRPILNQQQNNNNSSFGEPSNTTNDHNQEQQGSNAEILTAQSATSSLQPLVLQFSPYRSAIFDLLVFLGNTAIKQSLVDANTIPIITNHSQLSIFQYPTTKQNIIARKKSERAAAQAAAAAAEQENTLKLMNPQTDGLNSDLIMVTTNIPPKKERESQKNSKLFKVPAFTTTMSQLDDIDMTITYNSVIPDVSTVMGDGDDKKNPKTDHRSQKYPKFGPKSTISPRLLSKLEMVKNWMNHYTPEWIKWGQRSHGLSPVRSDIPTPETDVGPNNDSLHGNDKISSISSPSQTFDKMDEAILKLLRKAREYSALPPALLAELDPLSPSSPPHQNEPLHSCSITDEPGLNYLEHDMTYSGANIEDSISTLLMKVISITQFSPHFAPQQPRTNALPGDPLYTQVRPLSTFLPIQQYAEIHPFEMNLESQHDFKNIIQHLAQNITNVIYSAIENEYMNNTQIGSDVVVKGSNNTNTNAQQDEQFSMSDDVPSNISQPISPFTPVLGGNHSGKCKYDCRCDDNLVKNLNKFQLNNEIHDNCTIIDDHLAYNNNKARYGLEADNIVELIKQLHVTSTRNYFHSNQNQQNSFSKTAEGPNLPQTCDSNNSRRGFTMNDGSDDDLTDNDPNNQNTSTDSSSTALPPLPLPLVHIVATSSTLHQNNIIPNSIHGAISDAGAFFEQLLITYSHLGQSTQTHKDSSQNLLTPDQKQYNTTLSTLANILSPHICQNGCVEDQKTFIATYFQSQILAHLVPILHPTTTINISPQHSLIDKGPKTVASEMAIMGQNFQGKPVTNFSQYRSNYLQQRQNDLIQLYQHTQMIMGTYDPDYYDQVLVPEWVRHQQGHKNPEQISKNLQNVVEIDHNYYNTLNRNINTVGKDQNLKKVSETSTDSDQLFDTDVSSDTSNNSSPTQAPPPPKPQPTPLVTSKAKGDAARNRDITAQNAERLQQWEDQMKIWNAENAALLAQKTPKATERTGKVELARKVAEKTQITTPTQKSIGEANKDKNTSVQSRSKKLQNKDNFHHFDRYDLESEGKNKNDSSDYTITITHDDIITKQMDDFIHNSKQLLINSNLVTHRPIMDKGCISTNTTIPHSFSNGDHHHSDNDDLFDPDPIRTKSIPTFSSPSPHLQSQSRVVKPTNPPNWPYQLEFALDDDELSILFQDCNPIVAITDNSLDLHSIYNMNPIQPLLDLNPAPFGPKFIAAQPNPFNIMPNTSNDPQSRQQTGLDPANLTKTMKTLADLEVANQNVTNPNPEVSDTAKARPKLVKKTTLNPPPSSLQTPATTMCDDSDLFDPPAAVSPIPQLPQDINPQQIDIQNLQNDIQNIDPSTNSQKMEKTLPPETISVPPLYHPLTLEQERQLKRERVKLQQSHAENQIANLLNQSQSNPSAVTTTPTATKLPPPLIPLLTSLSVSPSSSFVSQLVPSTPPSLINASAIHATTNPTAPPTQTSHVFDQIRLINQTFPHTNQLNLPQIGLPHAHTFLNRAYLKKKLSHIHHLPPSNTNPPLLTPLQFQHQQQLLQYLFEYNSLSSHYTDVRLQSTMHLDPNPVPLYGLTPIFPTREMILSKIERFQNWNQLVHDEYTKPDPIDATLLSNNDGITSTGIPIDGHSASPVPQVLQHPYLLSPASLQSPNMSKSRLFDTPTTVAGDVLDLHDYFLFGIDLDPSDPLHNYHLSVLTSNLYQNNEDHDENDTTDIESGIIGQGLNNSNDILTPLSSKSASKARVADLNDINDLTIRSIEPAPRLEKSGKKTEQKTTDSTTSAATTTTSKTSGIRSARSKSPPNNEKKEPKSKETTQKTKESHKNQQESAPPVPPPQFNDPSLDEMESLFDTDESSDGDKTKDIAQIGTPQQTLTSTAVPNPQSKPIPQEQTPVVEQYPWWDDTIPPHGAYVTPPDAQTIELGPNTIAVLPVGDIVQTWLTKMHQHLNKNNGTFGNRHHTQQSSGGGQTSNTDQNPPIPVISQFDITQLVPILPEPLSPDSFEHVPYCFCRTQSVGEMVGCESDDCPYEWFHYQCVGLSSAPRGAWYCLHCIEKLVEKVRVLTLQQKPIPKIFNTKLSQKTRQQGDYQDFYLKRTGLYPRVKDIKTKIIIDYNLLYNYLPDHNSDQVVELVPVLYHQRLPPNISKFTASNNSNNSSRSGRKSTTMNDDD